MEVFKNVTNKLVDQVLRLEQKCWENKQYSRSKCIEISGIPHSIKQTDLEKTVLKVFEKTVALVDLQNIKASHRLKSDDHG